MAIEKQPQPAQINPLENPMDLPDAFKAWLLKYIEVNPPNLPIAQMLGYQAAPKITSAPSGSPPAGPHDKDLWIVTDTNQVKRYDGGTSSWVLLSDSSAALASALATPVLRAEAGGSLLAAAATSYVCNMDGAPAQPGTLSNFVASTFKRASIDDAPSGFKTQWNLEVTYQTNNTSPNISIVWFLWEATAIGGAAGGYTTTMAGSATTPTQIAVNFAVLGSNQSEVQSGWNDDGVAGDIVSGKVYMFGVNIAAGGMAASSAVRFRMRLYRRFVPV